MSKLTLSPAWKALAAHRKKIAAANLVDLFAADPSRAERFLIEAGGLVLDYSKHRVDAEAMRLLAGLAAQAQLPRWIASMFAGDPINSTEARAVLHVALRSEDTTFPERGDVMPAVRSARERMRRFVARRGKQKHRVPDEPQGKGFRLDGMHGERKPSASAARMQDAPLYPALRPL